MVKENLNIYCKLQEVRSELIKKSLKKSGKNTHQNFAFFELGDFLPEATALFKENGLCPVFNLEDRLLEKNKTVTIKDEKEIITVENIRKQYAILNIHDGDSFIHFEIDAQDNVIYTKNGLALQQNPIQNLGAKITYLRRYLYLMALDIVENDIVEAQDQNVNDVVKKETTKKETSSTKKVVKSLNDPVDVAKEIENDTFTIMSDETKIELGNMVLKKGLDVKTTMEEICNKLGYTDLTAIPELAKEDLIKEIEVL